MTAPRQRCFIALGSNFGDKLRYLTKAVQRLRGLEGVRLRRTSTLYSTAAQYVTEQPAFLNAVAEVEISERRQRTLHTLIEDLKTIEHELGRKKRERHGQREIDLDIIAVDKTHYSSAEGTFPLEIPHPRMHERDFVLVPMAELNSDWQHPLLSGGPSVVAMLDKLRARECSEAPAGADPKSWPTQVIPAAGGLYGRKTGSTWPRNHRTLIMGILNITPDSFSDGGESMRLEDAVSRARDMAMAGADVLDIGGESTRPGAEEVQAHEEIQRVVPVIQAIRRDGLDIAVSIDTRKSEVAREAVLAGADFINDVSGGEFDPKMFSTAAEVMAPIILMHMKGTPQTMATHATYTSVVDEVIEHLIARREAAIQAGVPAWNVILDPGIGFAKTTQHNITLLRESHVLTSRLHPTPILVGASRKRFVGEILGEPDPKKRLFGNAATTATAVMGKVDIVRVHEVREMAQTARMCDEIYREPVNTSTQC